MAKRCEICGKGPLVGNHVSHAHNTTKRRWLPNLKKIRARIDGEVKRVLVCTNWIQGGKVVKVV
ncbi:MAG: 50S ribosomal protein L28 [bacterium]